MSVYSDFYQVVLEEPTVGVDPEHIHLPVAHAHTLTLPPPVVPVSPVALVASAVALPEDPALDYLLCRHRSHMKYRILITLSNFHERNFTVRSLLSPSYGGLQDGKVL
ncbi:unnamed protein product [Strongylus vulgaris]|uniref:Uncharacterized protein n=1 Tax=Strongylus vulgaris TaxID=40348 RepID=A0A3P7LRJ5_STRVU|nr:unnamed protein product [Strongylus vulgaris]